MESPRHGVLRALGYSGDIAMVEHLLPFLEGDDALAAKLSLEAISTLTGLDSQQPAFQAEPPEEDPEEEEAEALPSFEEDDLDADLEPLPVEDLPLPNGPAIRAWWHEKRRDFEEGRRYLGGRLWSGESIRRFLVEAPLRRRHPLALALTLKSHGQSRLDTRAFSWKQRPWLADQTKFAAADLFLM